MSAPSVVTVASARLATQEAIIDRGLKSFIEVGEALAEIREERLYLEQYSTFEEYCQERWHFTRVRAHQLISAASTALTIVNSDLAAPINEAQARELAKVPEPDREQVWRETLDRTGGKPTAAAVREVAAPPAAETKPVPEPRTRPGRHSDGTPNDAQVPVDPPAPAEQAEPKPVATGKPCGDAETREVSATTRAVDAALASYRECVAGLASQDVNAAVVAVAVIENYSRDVDDATCGAIARAVIAEHRVTRKASS